MSNNPSISQVGLSDDGNVTFLIRWRGRQEGPYTAAVIEVKLAANEISLLHEIFINGKWVTIRDYITENKKLQMSEHLAVETEIKKQSEKRIELGQRKKQRHEELLAEETRNKNLFKLVAESKKNNPEALRIPAPRDMRFVYGAIVVLIALTAIGAYTFIQIKADETARFQAEQQAKAAEAAIDAQKKIEAVNAGASVVNTIINAAVEANKPPQRP